MADNIIENIGDIDTTLNPVTKDHGLEILGNVSDQPVALRRFSRAIFKIGGLIKGLATGKEDKFSKNSAFNKNKSDVVNSNDSNTLATSKAIKTAYDRGSSGVTKADTAQNLANSAQTKANQAYTLANGKEPKFNKNSGFNLDITHLVNSTSKILVASALAVKTAYDKALEALGLANTNKNAIQNNTEQIENLSYNETLIFDGNATTVGEITLSENWDNFHQIVTIADIVNYGNNDFKTMPTDFIIPSDHSTQHGDSEITFTVSGSTVIAGKFRDTDRTKLYISEVAASGRLRKVIGINRK